MAAERAPRTQKSHSEEPPLTRSQRLRQLWQEYRWQFVLVLFAVSFTLGYIGFYKYFQGKYSPTYILYKTLQLTTLESGAVEVEGEVGGEIKDPSWELEVARFLVPLVTAYTALLGVAVLFRKELQMIRLWYIRKHIILCGLGEKGWLLASQLKQSGHNVVVIEKDSGNSRIDLCRENNIIVIEGDAGELSVLRKAAIQRASHLVAVCGDDSVNAEVAMGAKQLSSARNKSALNCTIHIINPQLCDLLREQELGFEAFPTFRLEMFNIFESGARALLSEYPPFELRIGSSMTTPHILVVGAGRLGENLVVQAARSWYEICEQQDGLLRISIIDKNAKEIAARIRADFPKLPGCCELIGYNMDLADPHFQDADFLLNADGHVDVSAIYICMSDQTLGLQSALKLRHRIDQAQPPIVVRMQEDSGLAKLLSGDQLPDKTFHNIIPFGLLQRTCTPNLVLGGIHEILAMAIHEDYLRNRLEEGLQFGQKRSLVHWDELPEELRESNHRQVDHIRLKLHSAGYGIKPLSDWEAAEYQFSTTEIELMSEMEHEHWVQERERNGWRFSTGAEDPKKKTHPDLLPWDQLPETVKDKDRQPTINLPRLLAKGGFQVYYLNPVKVKTRSKTDGA